MAYQNSPKIVTNGLVLCLDAGNTKSYLGTGTAWYDLYKSGYNGTLYNGIGFSSANSGSLTFDGTNDYLYVTNSTNTNIGTGNWSQNVWVKFNSTANQRITIKRFGGLGYGYSLYISSGAVGFEILTPSTYIIINGSSISTGVWYNFCVTLNRSGSGILYINGIQNSTADYSSFNGLDITNSYPLTLGAVDPAIVSGAYLNGNIAIVQNYNKLLTSLEVLQNYNATKSRFGL